MRVEMKELDESTHILKGNPLIKIYLTNKKMGGFFEKQTLPMNDVCYISLIPQIGNFGFKE